MEEKEMVVLQNVDGTSTEAELVTYLVSEDKQDAYVVYSKGEKVGTENDEIVYISKIIANGPVIKVGRIDDDNEWLEVQRLLKKVANAK